MTRRVWPFWAKPMANCRDFRPVDSARYRPHQNSYFNEPHDSEEYEAGGCFGCFGAAASKLFKVILRLTTVWVVVSNWGYHEIVKIDLKIGTHKPLHSKVDPVVR